MTARKKPAKELPKPNGYLVAYARVSTEDQNLELQLDAFERAGVRPDNVHQEKTSGVSAKRPALTRALMDCREGDTFIVWKLDRLGRDAIEVMARIRELNERGVHFRSLTEQIDTTKPMGRFMMLLHAGFAQLERDTIRERTKAGMQAYRERGGRVGPAQMLSREDHAKLKEMSKSGVSKTAIAKQFKMSTSSVANYLRRPLAPKH